MCQKKFQEQYLDGVDVSLSIHIWLGFLNWGFVLGTLFKLHPILVKIMYRVIDCILGLKKSPI